jgi:hypothetical protein
MHSSLARARRAKSDRIVSSNFSLGDVILASVPLSIQFSMCSRETG